MSIIDVSSLKKSYGTVEAVKGIDFQVEPGTLFAFLGPNGAGKSTTIDIICTLLKPDGGRVIIDGKELGRDDHQIRSSIGVVFQDHVLDPLLTVKENLYTRAKLYGLSSTQMRAAAERSIASSGVEEFVNRPYGKLSGGQKRRADIARALVHTPKILFLDEPTTGLDPQTRKNVWETIQALQAESGMTVFLTTHYMEEAAGADYVTIIDNGLISAQGTPMELKQKYSLDSLKILPRELGALTRFLEGCSIPYTLNDNLVSVSLHNTAEAIPIICECRQNIENFEVLNGTMDDVFINITGKEIRE